MHVCCDLTLVYVNLIMLIFLDDVLQVGIVALDHCSERIFGHIHALRGSLCQVGLVRNKCYSRVA